MGGSPRTGFCQRIWGTAQIKVLFFQFYMHKRSYLCSNIKSERGKIQDCATFFDACTLHKALLDTGD